MIHHDNVSKNRRLSLKIDFGSPAPNFEIPWLCNTSTNAPAIVCGSVTTDILEVLNTRQESLPRASPHNQFQEYLLHSSSFAKPEASLQAEGLAKIEIICLIFLGSHR